jgi:hypothetical protein
MAVMLWQQCCGSFDGFDGYDMVAAIHSVIQRLLKLVPLYSVNKPISTNVE